MKSIIFLLAGLLLCAMRVGAQIWEPANGPYVALVEAIAVNDAGDVFAGTWGDGIYRSTNGGDSWQQINVGDAVYIISYIFKGGPAPDPVISADSNCDGTVNVSDAVSIINYVFKGGTPPCDPDGDGHPDC